MKTIQTEAGIYLVSNIEYGRAITLSGMIPAHRRYDMEHGINDGDAGKLSREITKLLD